jgi:photosystem II stability/assembly factor-like uncharacterized protein
VYSCWASKHDLPLRKMFSYRDYFKYNFGGVCVSDDAGRTWRPTLKGISTSDILLDERSPANARVLYAVMCGEGFYKSTDGGETWAIKNNGLPSERPYAFKVTMDGEGTLFLCCLRAMEFPDDEPVMIPGRLYVSQDGAESWDELPMPEGETGINDLAADIHRSGGLYMTCRPGWKSGEGEGGLYYSANGGNDWARLPLDEGYTHCVAQDPAVPGRLLVSTFVNRLMRSDDYGDTWHKVGGFNFRAAHRPTPDPEDPSMIYVPCFGSSVWHGPVMGNGRDWCDISDSGARIV